MVFRLNSFLCEVIAMGRGRKPQTAIDLTAVFAAASKDKMVSDSISPSEKTERPEKSEKSEKSEKEYKSRFPSSKNPDVLDKYEDNESAILHASNAVKIDGFASSREKVYVVQDYNTGFIAGITKSWDIAWDILKMRLFNDHGEFTDKEAAYNRINEKGYVVLKSRIGNLPCIIKQMKIEE